MSGIQWLRVSLLLLRALLTRFRLASMVIGRVYPNGVTHGILLHLLKNFLTACILTLRAQDGVHLATFPEGTRSKSGRLGKFKNGAFKMAHKAGAPVIPMSIVGAGKQQPTFFMFPARPSRNLCKVVLHEPIESVGKTEDELAKCVREAMISGLPDDQRPKDGK